MAAVQGVATTEADVALNDADIRRFRAALRGRLIRPGDGDYDAARAVWNGMIDRRPALIARCEGVADVVAAVNFARDHNLPLAVRGGGHNVAGHGTCDGGLVIDLSPMRTVIVDPVARIARASGGVTIGDIDRATHPHGLAAPMGVVSETGIAGLTLGGGYGWLRNKHGLSCDNLIAAQVVTAEGRVVSASLAENSDLLWGLRGGGGNFGVVTELTYRLHPIGQEVAFGLALHDGEGKAMGDALRFGREFALAAPDEIGLVMLVGRVPPDPEMFPAELHGRPFVGMGAMYVGPAEEGMRRLQPLRDFAPPLMDLSNIMPYPQVHTLFDAEYPRGMRYYWKSLNVNRLDEVVIDRIVQHARRQPSPFSTLDIWHVGGAVRRVPEGGSAFGGREAAFLVSPEANWQSPADDDANIAWVRGIIADMEAFSDGSRYLNFAGFQEEGDDMMRGAFGAQYARLVALKRKYDPGNLFRLNQNIRPQTI